MVNGCDGFEFDVRYTRDRRSSFPTIRSSIASNRGVEYAGLERRRGYNLACLEDVLAQFGSAAYLDVELKVPATKQPWLLRCAQIRPFAICGVIFSS